MRDHVSNLLGSRPSSVYIPGRPCQHEAFWLSRHSSSPTLPVFADTFRTPQAQAQAQAQSSTMKSAIAAVALFAMGTLAAAMPVAEPKPSPTNVEANTPTFVADAALTTYYGVSLAGQLLLRTT